MLSRNVNGIGVLPRQDGFKEGNIASHEVYVSADGTYWVSPVAYGTWWTDETEKHSSLETVQAHFLRLVTISDAMKSSWTSIAESDVYINPDFIPTPAEASMGMWGPKINTPIVPVSAFVDPYSCKVVMLSKKHHPFPQDGEGWTLTAIWDPIGKDLSQAKIHKTDHNMFCPRMSFDAEGRMIVTGGASGKRTTIFDGAVDDGSFRKQWHNTSEMHMTRGYQSAVLNADGRMFVLGGSWGAKALMSPKDRIKNGEVYDTKADTWTKLPLCDAQEVYTKDYQNDRIDNHLRLFAWKNDTMFHRGPSKHMSWFTINESGGWKGAGTRTPSDGFTDNDAMCGEAVIYDAVGGHVATFGGAPWYEKGPPVSNETFILTLGEPNGTVEVERAEQMAYSRTFASAVVVPNGDILASGGQGGIPEVFVDKNPVLQVEMFSPTSKSWTTLASNSIVRVSHSWTLLLPDATIMNGGGGLCGDTCDGNHFDAQIYTPPDLFTSYDQPAPRPVIRKISSKQAKPGDPIFIRSGSALESASLLRYGSTTHAVNTDQRRIPLELSRRGTDGWAFEIPCEGYVAIPGYWMLFAMDAHGVPSVAETI